MQGTVLLTIFAASAVNAYASGGVMAISATPEPAFCFLIGGSLLALGILSRKFTGKAGVN
jgi:hypothetical protein